MAAARQGLLHGGLPYRAAGDGPPVVVFPGISADNADPTGRQRRMNLRPFQPLTRRFTVYVVNRKPGLKPGSTLGDLAGRYADAIAHEFGGPVPVIGVSTGGSIAQLLAIDHPHLVDRLVLVASACRLSPYGRHVQRRLAHLTAAGRPRRAWAATGPALAATTAGGWLATALMWLAGARMNAADASDLLITIEAEDVVDTAPGLPRITAPTLVIGGARDRFYSPDLFNETAQRIPGARLRLYPGRGHVGTVAHRPAIDEILRFLTGEAPRRREHRPYDGKGDTAMSYGITVRLPAPFPATVQRVRAALQEQGFGVLTEIDVQATLREKLHADMEEYVILGACNPPLAHRALAADRDIGLLLHCNVVIRADGPDATLVQALDPHVMVQVTGRPQLKAVADEAAARLRAALRALAG